MKTLIKYHVTESMDFDKIEFIETIALVGGITALIFLSALLA